MASHMFLQVEVILTCKLVITKVKYNMDVVQLFFVVALFLDGEGEC